MPPSIHQQTKPRIKNRKRHRPVNNPVQSSGPTGFVQARLHHEAEAEGKEDEAEWCFDEPGAAVVGGGGHGKMILAVVCA
jgi:hypothetical protein